MRQQEKIEGIVLRSTDYKEGQRILTLFTRDAGLFTLLVKNLHKRPTSLIALSSMLAQGEFVLIRKGKDLWEIVEGMIHDGHFGLRCNLIYMECAGHLARMILSSQLPGRPAPLLYDLLLSYLSHLTKYQDPRSLVVSFQLKLLRHEGILDITKLCTQCKIHPPRYLAKGESLCSLHATTGARPFTEDEWNTLYALLHGRNFSKIAPLSIDPEWIVWLYTLL